MCVVQFYLLYSPFKVSANAQVLQSEIVGSVKMNVHLTGMPELRLGLNDKILFENTGRKLIMIHDSNIIFLNMGHRGDCIISIIYYNTTCGA